MIDVEGGPDLDGGDVGVAEAGTVLSWGERAQLTTGGGRKAS